MSIEIIMPRLSDTMEQGTVIKWHVKEGDAVRSGDIVADIETDKATMELQTFDDGTVAKFFASEGQTVPIGAPICILAEEGESVEEAAGGSTAASSSQTGKVQSQSSQTAQRGSSAPSATAVATPSASHAASQNGVEHAKSTHDRIFASPLARKIASEQGIDLARVQGSGPSGRITRKDVERLSVGQSVGAGAGTTRAASSAATPSAPAPLEPLSAGMLEDRTVSLSNMRATIAKRLVQSKTTVPHYQVTLSARLDALLTLRAELNEQLAEQGVKLSVNDFLVRACALAMHQHPFVNSSWNPVGPAIDLHSQVNIGVAISLPVERGGGLVVATIRNADCIGLRQISAQTKHLAKKAREKGLTVEEMADSTFTISNLGMFGVDHFTAIINPPNAAILAVGRAIEKPFFDIDEDGEPCLVLGHEMSMTISSDHRIIDGVMAAAYLQSVKSYLESPASLLV